MSHQIAFCGNYCDKCPTYIATQSDDDEARKKVAVEWSKNFGFSLEHRDINCDGCQAKNGARLFGHCESCEARLCGIDRGVDNCGKCADYHSCDKIKQLHQLYPIGKKALDKIHEE